MPLDGRSEVPLSSETIKNVESFVCKQHQRYQWHKCSKAEVVQKSSSTWALTTYQRCFAVSYQMSSYPKCSLDTGNFIEDPSMGWALKEEVTPVLSSLPPVPDSCLELTRCSCTSSQVAAQRCSCRKNKLCCTGDCKCSAMCMNTKD